MWLPDLPPADYTLWVRGYGLADSAKVSAKRGTHVNLTAVVAPNDAVAAQVYPAVYWYSMMHLPSASELAGIPGGMNRYLAIMKNEGCVGCHQLGEQYTRTLPTNLGAFPTSQDAWARRIQSGQAGANMIGQAAVVLHGLPIKYLTDWTDRIARGELPAHKPQRPTGVERNVVATIWDWSSPKPYMHDLTGTDWRNPTVNAYGPLYGAPELSTDEFPILDPKYEYGDHVSRAGARRRYARGRASASASFPHLGGRGHLDEQDRGAQSDHGPEGARLVHGRRSRSEQQSGVLQGGVGQSFRKAVSDDQFGSAARRV